MSLLILILIAGLILKAILIFIESLIYRLSVKYPTTIISQPQILNKEDISLEKTEMEIEVIFNSLKQVDKRIATSQGKFRQIKSKRLQHSYRTKSQKIEPLIELIASN